jgi:pyruvate dehydrogenase E2 component (dihydrolipoyllysine-residue acetyltransferase)
MNQSITMPALSDTMSNGRLVKWSKKVGDPIKKGETVAEVETDKAVMDVEAFHDGYLAGPLAAENTEMPVGQVIGYITDIATATGGRAETAAPKTPSAASLPKTSSLPTPPPPAPTMASTPETSPPTPQLVSPPSNTGHTRTTESATTVRASPYARRLAEQLGVDLRKVVSGQADVHADAILNTARRPPMPNLDAGPPYSIASPSSVRESVARNMIQSLATPTFRVVARLDVGPLRKAAADAQISFTLLLARAGALSVKANPLFNAAYTPEGLAMRQRVDVGIAVDTPDGLIAVVLRDVTECPVSQLTADWQALRDKVNSRRLKPTDYEGATFYLSNLGTFPVVHSFDAVIPLGAAAILSVGAAEEGRASFTLSCDHRVVAGADAARFFQSFAQFLADPSTVAGTSST